MSVRDFQVMEEVGNGSFASVFKVRRLTDDCVYAMKKVKLWSLNEKERENALNQVRILASVQNPHIISYKQCFLEKETATLYLITEFADNGDLDGKIKSLQNSEDRMEETEVFNYILQMAKALKALHSSNIIHRDLKCANIFLFKDGRVKIGDMNVSKVIKEAMCQTQTGTPYYASPQIWKDTPYNTKSDIWSLGCILYEMMMLNPPFMAESMEDLYKKVMKGIYPKISSSYSKVLRNLVRMMLQVNSNARPDICFVIEYLENSKDKEHLRRAHLETQHKDGRHLGNRKQGIKTAKKINQNQENEQQAHSISLIETIKMPKKITSVANLLPKSNYNTTEHLQELKLPFLKRKKISIKLLPSIDKTSNKMEHRLAKVRSQKLIPLLSSVANRDRNSIRRNLPQDD